MKSVCACLAAAAAMAAVPVMAQGADDAALEPDSNWVAKPADSHCSLTRRFGQDRPIHFQIRRFPGDDLIEFALFGRDVDLSRRGEAALASWGPDVPLRPDSDPYKMRSKVGPGVLFRSNLRDPGEELADGSNPARDELWSLADVFVLDGVVLDPIRLRTGSMQGAMRALDNCVDRLMAGWGVQPSRIGPRVRDLDVWGRNLTRDYPPAAMMAGTQGSVRTILVIDETGRVERCFAQLRVRNDELQDHACGVLTEHALFDPALGEDGAPIKSLTTFSITYQLY